MKSLEDRKAQAEKIALQPYLYKVCEGCDSIVVRDQLLCLCPNCHSYRFNENPVVVALHAELLGSRVQTSVTADDLY